MFSAAAALLSATAANAQSVGVAWSDVETLDDQLNAPDHGVEMVHWVDTTPNPDVEYVFVAGFVTDPNTPTATRIAVWKYHAERPVNFSGVPADVAYFPPLDVEDVTGLTKATGIAIDGINGNVYVTGYTKLDSNWGSWPTYGSDYNYVTLKYDAGSLDPNTTWPSPGTGVPVGFNLYDSNGLDDKAVDIKVDAQGFSAGETPYVYVTGSSESGGATDLDILSLKYEQDGQLSDSWASGPDPEGVRTYDYDGGDDYPVGIDWLAVTEPSEQTNYWAFVAGTGYSSNTEDNDIIAIAYDDDGRHGSPPVSTTPRWEEFYHGYDHDVATGLAERPVGVLTPAIIAVTGYSVLNADIDYVTVAYDDYDGTPTWSPEHRYWDGPESGTDFATSAAYGYVGDPPSGFWVLWVTGRTEDDDEEFDVGTVLYDDTGTLLCDDAFEYGAGTDDRGAVITADDDQSAWIGGTAVVSNIQNALTLRYRYDGNDVPEPCVFVWSVLHPLTDAIDPNSALGILIANNGGLGPFITGYASASGSGENAVVVRYEETP